MADNSFTIGATVDVAELQAGMNAGAETVQQSLDKMLVSFQEASPAAARAVARISDDTRAAAAEVDESWQRMARATLAYNASLKEVSAATYLARKSSEDDAAAVNLLAAAKQKAALASAELAAAEEAQAAEELESAGAIEALTAAFGTLEAVVAPMLAALAGIAIGIHFFDKSSDFAVQMQNLSQKVGISAETLAGLHDVMKETGGDFEAAANGLTKMLKAQHDAEAGSKKQIEGFRMMGVSVKDLKGELKDHPDELFFRLAEGFQKSGTMADKNAAAIEIFGKGGAALLPIFEAGGSQLRHWTEEAAKLSGVTKESIEASIKWNSVTEQLEVTMRRLSLEALPYVEKGIAGFVAGMDAIGAVFQTVFEAIAIVVVSAVEGIASASKLLYDVVNHNFAAVYADSQALSKKVVGIWKDGAKDIEGAWKSVGSVYQSLSTAIKVPDLPDLSGKEKGDTGEDTRLEQWRTELQARKDAEEGFQELSKTEEAKFWQAKLETVKKGSKLYGEVYHEMREAERGAQKDSLKDEENTVRDRVAATKEGSAERVAILREEVNHLKSIGADQTEDFKRTQTELAAAVHAYAEQQGKDAVEGERRKVEATRKGSEERVAAERAVLAELKSLGLEETNEYTAQLQRITDAIHEASEERVKLEELDIEQARISGQAKIQLEKQNVQAEFDLHRLNAQQRIAALKDLEDQEYTIEKTALEKKAALLKQDPTTSPVMLQQVYNAIENLTREHNDKMAALNTQGVKESQQKYDQFFEKLNTGFVGSINAMMTHSKSFVKSMEEMWNQLVTSLVDYIAKLALQWAEQHLVMRAISLIFHTQDVASQVAAEQAKTVATTAGTTQRGALEDVALLKTIARHIIEIASHVAKELAKTAATIAGVLAREIVEIAAHIASIARDAAEAAAGAFKWVMATVPFPLDLVLAPVTAAAAFAGVMAVGSAEGGAFLSHDTVLQAHRNEMVLPAPLSMGFKNIIGQMSTQGGSGSGSGSGAGGGVIHNDNRRYGDVVVNQTNNRMTPEEIAAAVRIAQRSGHLDGYR